MDWVMTFPLFWLGALLSDRCPRPLPWTSSCLGHLHTIHSNDVYVLFFFKFFSKVLTLYLYHFYNNGKKEQKQLSPSLGALYHPLPPLCQWLSLSTVVQDVKLGRAMCVWSEERLLLLYDNVVEIAASSFCGTGCEHPLFLYLSLLCDFPAYPLPT